MPIEPEVLRSALRFREDPPRLRVDLDPDTLYADIKDAFATREHAGARRLLPGVRRRASA